MSQLNDISLVAQVVVFKNTRAFDQLVKKYQSPVRRFFLNLTCGDSELSDDLAQDTFIKAYTNLSSFHNLSSFSTWLYRIAYNVFYDFMRSRKCSEEYSPDVSVQDYELPSETLTRNIDIYRAMQILKPEERAIIQLFYLEDLSLNKVSEIMNMPSGTVKSHLSRARQRLNVYLDKEDYKYGE